MATHSSSRTPSLTPSRSPTPSPPVQPDHFYSSDSNASSIPSSPESSDHNWLSPDDDPLATRGIPVFKPTMEEFVDFEEYVTKVECWGERSGIVKIIPPKEWTDALPSLLPQLANVRLKSPIEQHMLGRSGLYRQQNIEKKRHLSVREWAELCEKEELRAPGVDEVGLKAAVDSGSADRRKRPKRKAASAKDDVKGTPPTHDDPVADAVIVKAEDDDMELMAPSFDDDTHMKESEAPISTTVPPTPLLNDMELHQDDLAEPRASPAPSTSTNADVAPPTESQASPNKRKRRQGPSRAERDAALARRARLDREYLDDFDPHCDWLPPNTTVFDYTPEFCAKLERRYWRNCGLGKPAWYGADMEGSLFTDQTTFWNVAHLPSTLSRLLPASANGLPGVNTPYLYFGMWRATFAWHVEDMDLFSINYIHFGAGKFWYAMPQGRSVQMENTMRSYFPRDMSQCQQFLRHKSFLASPKLLSESSCKPNMLVQHAGEFVITFPRGYHAGFNLGFNCAESVNFALDSWLDIGRKAQACGCVGDSVRIDVDQLLHDRAEERLQPEKVGKPAKPRIRKRKPEAHASDSPSKPKRIRVKPNPDTASHGTKVTLTFKMPPKPVEPEPFPCCLCVSMTTEGLLRVHDKAGSWSGCSNIVAKDEMGKELWRAHEACALVVPETWVDELDIDSGGEEPRKEKVVFGVDGIVRDRWNLKCSSCTKTRHKAHGAPIQCTKGKCSKAFHVSCARDGSEQGIRYTVLQEIEKEVILLEPPSPALTATEVLPVSTSKHEPSSMVADPDALVPSSIHSAPSSEPDRQTQSSACTVQPMQTSEPSVVKVIKKLDVEVLCSQHNPAIAAAKKASKMDKVRHDLLALPEMSRIKLRVSAGVFEVSLVRVIEERNSVEVLWDGGIKKEFKWSSLLWGNTEGQSIGQKPSVPALPETSASTAVSTSLNANGSLYRNYSSNTFSTPVTSYHVTLPTHASASGGSSSERLRQDQVATSSTFHQATSTHYPYGSGPYPYHQQAYLPPSHMDPSAQMRGNQYSYYPMTPMFPGSPYAPYGYTHGYPYPYASYSAVGVSRTTSIPPNDSSPFTESLRQTAASTVASLPSRQLPEPASTFEHSHPSSALSAPTQLSSPDSSATSPGRGTDIVCSADVGPVEQATPDIRVALQEVQALSGMDSTKVEELLRSKPSLRDAVRVLLAHQEAQGQSRTLCTADS